MIQNIPECRALKAKSGTTMCNQGTEPGLYVNGCLPSSVTCPFITVAHVSLDTLTQP